ncbi:ABC transporter substrate-binding protein [Nocardia sp. alder85J]|uniref:ABC transporter substrate-binding protein n=1 Tax=Nocardia sp. alder85J TaxID=2862949 RepID=UPI001CD3A086|nr:ABC transporter substrate-binding protein [Nocardia sp. alder85J]MCX4092515.1 ABC transporter substrate-binding protein [Nocardia sp. alder85J]
MTKMRKLATIAGALALAVVAGCSSTASKSAGGDTVSVGVICSCSGGSMTGFDVPVQDAVRAWADTANAAGGINGHKVELVLKDDGMNPGSALSAAKSLITAKVAAVVDISILDQSWSSAVEAAKIPVVGVLSNNKPFETSPYFFPEGQTGDKIHQAIVGVAKQAGAANLGFLYCAEAPVCAESATKLTDAGKEHGLPVTYNTKISATAPNYTAQCVAAQQQGVSALYIGSTPAVIAHVAEDCARQNYHPIYVIQGAAYASNLAAAPGLSENTWIQFSSLPFFADSPAVQRFNTAMDAKFPGVRQDSNIFIHNAIMGWVSGQVLEQAVRNGAPAGTAVTSDTVVKGLESLRDFTADGLAPPLTFTAGQPHHIDCWFTARVQGGTPQVLNDGKTTCA